MGSAYLISEDEYVRANKLFTQLSPKRKAYYAVVSVLLIGLAFFAKSHTMQLAVFGALIGGVVGHLAVRHGVAPWQTRRQYRDYRAAQESFDIELEDKGLRFRAPNTDSLLEWKYLMRWREDQEFVLVYQNSRLYHIIPRRLSSDGFDMTALIARLEREVGHAT